MTAFRLPFVQTEIVEESEFPNLMLETLISQNDEGVFPVTNVTGDNSETLRRVHVPTENEVFFAGIGNFYDTHGGAHFEAPSLNVLA